MKLVLIAFTCVSSLAYANQNLACNQVVNANVCEYARTSLKSVTHAKLELQEQSMKFETVADFSPRSPTLGLDLISSTQISSDGSTLIAQEHRTNCGKDGSKDCYVRGEYDLKTKRLHVSAYVGKHIPYVEADYLLQCR